jgi:hypothetical protein
MVIGHLVENYSKNKKKIVTLSQYIFSLLLFVFNNRDYFVSNSVYHNNNTRRNNDLHLPQVSLAMYQKGVYYSGIVIFNSLPRPIKNISSKPKKFKIALKHFLHTHFTVYIKFLANSNI